MFSSLRNRIIAILAFLGAVAALSGGVWWAGYISALDQLAQRGRSDLALAADRLTSELQRYRELAVLMADHPTVAASVLRDEVTAPGLDLLREVADKTGSLDILVLRPNGEEIASASGAAAMTHAGLPYLERALDGALGVFHGVDGRYDEPARDARRTFLFAAPVFSGAGPVAGAVVVVVDVQEVETEWRGDRPTVFFTDDLGIVFVSNRDELLFRARGEGQTRSGNATYPPDLIRPFVAYDAQDTGGHDVWALDAGRYLPARALHLSMPLPIIGMTGEALLNVAPARQVATLQAAVAAAICLAFGAMLFLATERRRTLAEANQRLEGAVARRTAALSELNTDLRREVAERIAAEAQLKKAQADLVQAGKLSALGQMSAGISHELNQPLMAIRSYAENASAFLDRGQPEVADQNLGRIADLARRMGRIIRNLRSFAKQESEALTDVDLQTVIEGVLEMVEARARSSGVVIDWTPPAAPVMVRAGEVRLGQVVLNLVNNAMDAMQGQEAEKRVSIRAEHHGDRVELTVRDTGPGLDEPDKIFDPFYSTKTVEQDGMGLGLSISYGLVQSFGGVIRGRNHEEGGAVFTVELDLAPNREAAA